MYTKIMVPIDLAHAEQLGKALTTAADLSKHYSIPICYVGVAAATPGSIAHNPSEFKVKLEQLEKSQTQTFDLEGASSTTYISHDPTIDLDATLLKAIKETGSDLVVMASHIPGFSEYLFSSNAGYVATHAKVSVLVVR